MTDRYASPQVRDLGTVPEVTADPLDGGLHFAAVPLISGGTPGPGPGTPVVPDPTVTADPTATATATSTATATATATATSTPDVGTGEPPGGGGEGSSGGDGQEIAGFEGTGGSDPRGDQTIGGESVGPSTGTSSPSGATGTIPAGGGESLPFTGFAAAAVAALGGALTSAGAVLRRLTRQR